MSRTRTAPSVGAVDALTPRQREIAKLAALGVDNAGVATRLGVTAAVVQAELEALYRALGDDGRADGDDDRRAAHEARGDCR
jgi:DNA-binding NarL/FixJ family response regulator